MQNARPSLKRASAWPNSLQNTRHICFSLILHNPNILSLTCIFSPFSSFFILHRFILHQSSNTSSFIHLSRPIYSMLACILHQSSKTSSFSHHQRRIEESNLRRLRKDQANKVAKRLRKNQSKNDVFKKMKMSPLIFPI